MAKAVPPVGQWSTGLCSCCQDCDSFCCVFWCPCVVAGRIAELTTDGRTDRTTGCLLFYLLSCVGCQCLYSFGHRKNLRQMYQLPEKPCNDCIIHWLCLGLSLCQEERELKNRGWVTKMSLSENKAKFAAMQYPPPQQKMVG